MSKFRKSRSNAVAVGTRDRRSSHREVFAKEFLDAKQLDEATEDRQGTTRRDWRVRSWACAISPGRRVS